MKVYVLLLLALGLRVISLHQSLWLDEATQILASRDREFWPLMTEYAVGDFHPPLYHAILWAWLRLVPATESLARLPSVFFGVGTVWLTYKLGELINKRIGVLASVLLILSPLHVYYSQEARMYSAAAFFAALSMYGLLAFLRYAETNSRISASYLGIYAAGTFGLLWTEYVPYLLLPVQFLTVLYKRRSIGFRRFLFLIALMTFLLGSLIVAWGPIFARQYVVGITFAQTVPEWGRIVGGFQLWTIPLTLAKFVYGRIPLPNQIWLQAILALPLILFYAVVAKALTARLSVWLKLWLVVPLVLGVLVSLQTPIFSYFRFLYLLPALFLLFAKGAYLLPELLRTVSIGFMVIVLATCTILTLFIPAFWREDWKGAARYMDAQQVRVGFYLHIPPDPYRYYTTRNSAVGLLGGAGNLNDPTVYENIRMLTAGDTFLLVPYLREISDPKGVIASALSREGFVVQEERSFRGVGTIGLYRRL